MFLHTKSVQLKGIGPETLVGLGLACNGAWVNMAFKSLTLYGNSSNAVSHEPVLDAIYLISIVSVCVTLSIASLMERRTWSVLAHFPTFIALAVGTAATTLFMPLGDLGGTHLQQIILVLAGVLSGFFSGLFLLYFGMALAQLTLRGRVVAAATSTIFASISFVLFNMLHPDLAIPVAVGAPLLSAFFLLFGMRYAEQDNSSPADPDSTSELGTGQEGAFSRPFFKALLRCKPSPIADPVERANWRGLVWRIAIASLLVGFASESVRTIYTDGSRFGRAVRLRRRPGSRLPYCHRLCGHFGSIAFTAAYRTCNEGLLLRHLPPAHTGHYAASGSVPFRRHGLLRTARP